MVFKSKSVGLGAIIKRQVFAIFVSVLSLLVVSLPTTALELGVSFHQGEESDTKGYNLSLSDNFSRRGNIYWTLAYNKLDKVQVEWNNSALSFPVESIEAALSYRWSFRKPPMRDIEFEFQLGAATSLTDNKFFWTQLDEEKYFSETGDVTAFVAVSTRYKVTPQASLQLGIKHYPDFYEFGSVSSVFVGFNYNFGGQSYAY
jgi:hypothetical protein